MSKFFATALLQVLLCSLPSLAFSQTKLKITGSVTDSIKPVSLVTIRLFKDNNKTALQTALSNDNGNFQLDKPATGNYILSFTHTGFAEKTMPVAVTATASDMQIDPVKLEKATGELKGVTVTSQRPMIEQSDDKIVFNVEDDPTNKTGTAIDILRKTPFVSVDGEDNVKVNGKSNFKVLLNGRETSMFARNIKEALRGFPGTLISRIEVITAPSAKYDGEGIGGLINIITKKKIVGYNGTLSTFSRTSDKINSISVNGNAKMGNLGLSVFFNTGHGNPTLQHNTSTTIPTVPTAYSRRVLDGAQYASSGWSFGNAELSWDIDSLNTVSVYTNIDSWSGKTVSDQNITTSFLSSPSTVSNYQLSSNNKNPGVSVGSDYIRHFSNKKDREFSLRFLGEFGKANSFLNSLQESPGTDDRFLVNNSYANNNQYTIQADNAIPLKHGRLDGGLKAILRRATSDFESLVKYDKSDPYTANPANTDNFKYSQNVYSAYSMYTYRTKKSSFRLGARVEHTTVDGDFVSSQTKVKNDYTTLLPNLQFTNKISGITTFVLGYTKRLQRPYIWDLNPFVNNNDSLNISYGNPALGPQTVHAVNAQLRFVKGNTFAGINLEGTYSGNKILQYSSFDPATGVTRTTSLNIGKEYQSSLNLNFNTKLTQKWTVNINGSLRYARVTNNSDASQKNTGFGGNFNFNTSYKFTEKFWVSTYYGFWKDPQTIQSSFPFSTWHNVAFNYKVFKQKLNISLRAVNYYEKTHDYNTITKDKNFYNSNVTRQIRRGGVLSLTWNFGKLTENVSKKKGVTNDDLLTKPAGSGGN